MQTGTFRTETGQRLIGVHSPQLCAGKSCCIHNPSDHPLKDAPRKFISPGYMMVRICEHGIEHPDPDHLADVAERLAPEMAEAQAAHVCCGCCGVVQQ